MTALVAVASNIESTMLGEPDREYPLTKVSVETLFDCTRYRTNYRCRALASAK